MGGFAEERGRLEMQPVPEAVEKLWKSVFQEGPVAGIRCCRGAFQDRKDKATTGFGVHLRALLEGGEGKPTKVERRCS